MASLRDLHKRNISLALVSFSQVEFFVFGDSDWLIPCLVVTGIAMIAIIGVSNSLFDHAVSIVTSVLPIPLFTCAMFACVFIAAFAVSMIQKGFATIDSRFLQTAAETAATLTLITSNVFLPVLFLGTAIFFFRYACNRIARS